MDLVLLIISICMITEAMESIQFEPGELPPLKEKSGEGKSTGIGVGLEGAMLECDVENE